jgi:hypothetical protein
MTAEPTVTAVRLPVHNNAEWDAAVLVNADAPELRPVQSVGHRDGRHQARMTP